MRLIIAIIALSFAACSADAIEQSYIVYDQQVEVGAALCGQIDRCSPGAMIDVDACALRYAQNVCEQAYVDEQGVARISNKCWVEMDPNDAATSACIEALGTVACNQAVTQGICKGIIH